MAVKEMEMYLHLKAQAEPLLGGRPLTLQECGCLAMAAQYAAAGAEDAQRALRSIERSAAEGRLAMVCYQLLKLQRADFDGRVTALGLPSAGDRRLVDTTWLVKSAAARSGTLRDFVLTGQYRFYPAFFRQYDTFTHSIQDNEEGAKA